VGLIRLLIPCELLERFNIPKSLFDSKSHPLIQADQENKKRPFIKWSFYQGSGGRT
jgi:hypothetical protein